MTIAVIAVHPDDETLGAGGTLLRHQQDGDVLHWVIVTTVKGIPQYAAMEHTRDREIERVATRYGFQQVWSLGYPTTQLDQIPRGEIIAKVSDVLHQIRPDILYVPFYGDAHSDHRIIVEALHSATKVFRLPTLRAVRMMEVLSETNFALSGTLPFTPNYYVDITPFLDRKIEIMKIYRSEIGVHPFPRSEEAIRALAVLRGSESGFGAAEAFVTLFERW